MRNLLLIAALLGIALTGCKKKPEKEVTITSITVTTPPSKTTYIVGEPFDLTGMVVTANYSDGTSASVTVNSGMITFDSSTAGTKTATITVEYKGKKVTTTVSVTVNAPEATLVSIAITGTPDKKTYEIGDAFNPAGITVTATYSDNSTKPVPLTDLVFDAEFSNEAGTNKTVTVKFTYKGVTKTANITGITVTEGAPVSLAVTGTLVQTSYGIGEPLNFTGLTVTATYANNSTKVIAHDNPDLSTNDFSAAAGNNKTVTVLYKGASGNVAGSVNVLTLEQRVAAIPGGGAGVIKLYADENIWNSITIDNYKTITIEGVGIERTIKYTATYIMFLLTNGHLILGTNVTLDGDNVGRNYQSTIVSVNSGATFTMKNGSKITNSLKTIGTTFTRGGAVMVNHETASFIMEGGEITNCIASFGAGVAVASGTFTMSGGSITGNTATHYGNDVEINASANIFNLSGNAIMGDLLLVSSGSVKTTVTLSSNFTGSISGLFLGLPYVDTNIQGAWKNVRVITAASSATLTKELLEKFPLRFFGTHQWVGNYALTPITPGYHLYGTKAGEDTEADFGKLVAD